MNERASLGSLRAGDDRLPLHALGAELRAVLVRVKSAVDAEIAAYPTPIPRCDAQFNHLYEERSRLASLLARLDGARDDDAMAAAIAEFASAPAARDDAAANRLRARIEERLAPGG